MDKNHESSLEQEIARLKAENAALTKARDIALSLKVSEKGAISLYGMGRWPVTLYMEQWLKLLAFGDAIRAFAKSNESVLTTKAQSLVKKALADQAKAETERLARVAQFTKQA